MSNVKFPNYNKSKKLYTKKVSRETAIEAEKICMSLSVAILSDVFDFDDDQIHDFMDAYIKLADSLGIGKDDIDTINRHIKERFGVDVYKDY